MRLYVLTVFTVVVPRVVHGATWAWARVLVLARVLALSTTQADVLSHVVNLVVTLLVVTLSIGDAQRPCIHSLRSVLGDALRSPATVSRPSVKLS